MKSIQWASSGTASWCVVLYSRLSSLHCNWRSQFWRTPPEDTEGWACRWCCVWVPGHPGCHEVSTCSTHGFGWVLTLELLHKHMQIFGNSKDLKHLKQWGVFRFVDVSDERELGVSILNIVHGCQSGVQTYIYPGDPWLFSSKVNKSFNCHFNYSWRST